MLGPRAAIARVGRGKCHAAGTPRRDRRCHPARLQCPQSERRNAAQRGAGLAAGRDADGDGSKCIVPSWLGDSLLRPHWAKNTPCNPWVTFSG